LIGIKICHGPLDDARSRGLHAGKLRPGSRITKARNIARQIEWLFLVPLKNPIQGLTGSSWEASEHSCSGCRRLWGDGRAEESATARTGDGLPCCRRQ
jgi:hypothetical protein